MTRPEQTQTHPSWLKPVEPPSTMLGKLRSDARFRKRTLQGQQKDREGRRKALKTKHEANSEFIDFLYGYEPDIREVKFREAVTDFLEGKSGLRVLIVNHGDIYHEVPFPAELTGHSKKIDFLGKPTLYDDQLIEECNVVFGETCTFSKITEDELKDKRNEEGYDLVLILRDSKENEDRPRYSRVWSKKFAKDLVSTLKPGGSLFASADESLDNLRLDLYDIPSPDNDFSLEPHHGTVFANMDADMIYIPIDPRTSRIVWSISREDPDFVPEKKRRGWHTWSRRKRISVVSGGLAVSAGAAALAVALTQSPEQPHCGPDEIPIYPSRITDITPGHTSTDLPVPDGPDVTIDTNNGETIVSSKSWTKPSSPYTGNELTLLLPHQNVMLHFENGGNVLGCVAQKETPAPSSNNSIGSASIPGVNN